MSDIVAWDGVGKNTIKKKLAINQPREDLELWISYSIFNTLHVRYIYGTSLVLKQKCGLEFEREYSAILEGYMYVYYVSCMVPSRVLNALYAGLELEWADMQPTL